MGSWQYGSCQEGLLLRKCSFECSIAGNLHISFQQTVIGCYEWPFPPAAPEPDSFSWLLDPSLRCPKTQRSPSQMMDMAAAFLFRGLTSSKAKQVPQRLTHTDRGHGCSGCQRQGTAVHSIHSHNAFRSDLTARFPSSSSTGKDWHSVVKVHTLLCIPQALMWPLCPPTLLPGSPYPPHASLLTSWSHQVLVGNSPTGTPHLWIPKNIKMNSAHLIPLRGPRATQWLVQLENCE